MLNDATCFKKIFIVTGYTDLRSGIDRLADTVRSYLGEDANLLSYQPIDTGKRIKAACILFSLMIEFLQLFFRSGTFQFSNLCYNMLGGDNGEWKEKREENKDINKIIFYYHSENDNKAVEDLYGIQGIICKLVSELW